MKRRHFIGMDVHCKFLELAVVDAEGRKVSGGRCATAIPALVAELDKVPRPRALVIEEGPLADWLWRQVRVHVDDMVICEPRRNRLIARDGDKDDPIDAEKLAQLYRGGFVKAVHHGDSLPRAIFKQHVGLYHDAVRQRVRAALRISSLLRRHGVFVREKAFVNPTDRPALLQSLPKSRTLRMDVRLLWKGYDVLAAVEEKMRRRLVQLAKKVDVVRRFVEVPGIAWVRAATLYVWLDTPWRFRSKSALWKYLGIGLERRRSGNGPEHLGVPPLVNGALKSTILGAAKSAVAQDDNPFADQYRRWIEAGLSPKIARRNVARSLAATLLGLWKNGTAYRPEWVGVAAAASHAAEGLPKR
jgi:transposase